eukprot:SAG31_NODE_28563_length_408_cov_0.831715_1_plen_62_part_10
MPAYNEALEEEVVRWMQSVTGVEVHAEHEGDLCDCLANGVGSASLKISQDISGYLNISRPAK